MAQKATSHRERIETCLSGEKPDAVPVALWRHSPVDDQTPEGLAAATADFQRHYDFDLIKVTPASSFCIKDWGADDRWTGNDHGTRDYVVYPVQNPEDWEKLQILDPCAGHLGKQITCLQLLVEEFSPHTPILQTIFNPLSQAKNLAGSERLLVHLRRYPGAVTAGLKTITQTTIRFIEEIKKLDIAGIFFAIQHAQYGIFSESEFEIFCRPFDLQILVSADKFWLNVVHIHGENIMFDQVLDYPSAVLNWHDRSTQPSLVEAQKKYSGVVCGGLRQHETIVLGAPQEVTAEAMDAVQSTDGIKFILGTGCVTPIIAPHGNLLAARNSVREMP